MSSASAEVVVVGGGVMGVRTSSVVMDRGGGLLGGRVVDVSTLDADRFASNAHRPELNTV